MTPSALLAAAASFLALTIAFGPLQRAFPARAGQSFFRPEVGLDATFFLGQYLLWVGLSLKALEWLAPHLPTVELAPLRALPPILQGLVVVMLGDLLVYWFHRACHHFDLLWRFHAVHHSVTRLDWLAAHREHPLDGLFTQAVINLPALFLGVGGDVLAGWAVFRGMWAIFIHSNVALPLGPLGWLFGDPALHHWHHAQLERTTHNFSNLGPWVDWLFGTHHRPQGPETYPLGLVGVPPRGYLGQLLMPFVPRGLEAKLSAPAPSSAFPTAPPPAAAAPRAP
jgi:sterol desaturase/sphingolipid hydroxylase (fatty acid hydroxylase superfamily)